MSRSKRFIELFKRIKSIEKNLLPRIKTPGDYTKRELDMIRSYKLLVHAEIEAYVEERAKEKAISAVKSWKASRTKSNVLLALMSYNDIDYISFSNEKNTSDRDITVRIEKAVKQFMTKVSNNHGIKEINILEMLCPIGIEISELQQAWLNDLNSFGLSRGLVAHTSAKTQQPLDPVSEKNLITSIIKELENVDLKINAVS